MSTKSNGDIFKHFQKLFSSLSKKPDDWGIAPREKLLDIAISLLKAYIESPTLENRENFIKFLCRDKIDSISFAGNIRFCDYELQCLNIIYFGSNLIFSQTGKFFVYAYLRHFYIEKKQIDMLRDFIPEIDINLENDFKILQGPIKLFAYCYYLTRFYKEKTFIYNVIDYLRNVDLYYKNDIPQLVNSFVNMIDMLFDLSTNPCYKDFFYLSKQAGNYQTI